MKSFRHDDIRQTTDETWWQKLTWPLARWANKTDCHNITEKLLKAVLYTIINTPPTISHTYITKTVENNKQFFFTWTEKNSSTAIEMQEREPWFTGKHHMTPFIVQPENITMPDTRHFYWCCWVIAESKYVCLSIYLHYEASYIKPS